MPLSIGSVSSDGTNHPPFELRTVAETDVEELKEEVVTWSSLPHKGQLAVLTMARLSEPLVQTSLQVSWKAAILTKILSDL